MAARAGSGNIARGGVIVFAGSQAATLPSSQPAGPSTAYGTGQETCYSETSIWFIKDSVLSGIFVEGNIVNNLFTASPAASPASS